jgi:hypothetical protein
MTDPILPVPDFDDVSPVLKLRAGGSRERTAFASVFR